MPPPEVLPLPRQMENPQQPSTHHHGKRTCYTIYGRNRWQTPSNVLHRASKAALFMIHTSLYI